MGIQKAQLLKKMYEKGFIKLHTRSLANSLDTEEIKDYPMSFFNDMKKYFGMKIFSSLSKHQIKKLDEHTGYTLLNNTQTWEDMWSNFVSSSFIRDGVESVLDKLGVSYDNQLSIMDIM
ncbi:MAG: hypothetical protein ACRCVW_02580 [Brevinema sp.]